MAKRRRKVYEFRTIADMHMIPLEKLALFCEDLRLWLSMHRIASRQGLEMTSPRDAFAWIDDGRHEITVRIEDRRTESPVKDPAPIPPPSGE